MSLDGGTTWLPMSLVSGHNWRRTQTVGGQSYVFDLRCGGTTPAAAWLWIIKNSTPFPVSTYVADTWNNAYPAVWTFNTVSGSPPTWPGTTVKIRSQCSNTQVGTQTTYTNNAASITQNPFVNQKTGDTLVVFYLQNGTDGSGGTLATPSISTGFTLLHASADKRFYCWVYPNANGGQGFTVSGVSSADQQSTFETAIRTAPGASVVGSTFRDSVGAATVLSSNAMSFSGNPAFLIALFEQFRNALTSQGTATFSAATGGFTLQTQQSKLFVGSTPVFESQHYAMLSNVNPAAGSYTAGVTSTRSNAYNSGILAIR